MVTAVLVVAAHDVTSTFLTALKSVPLINGVDALK